ncbi:porin [Oceaniglobus trochenteri]|uniref:porin n=1 Tax=Oceaniglobus trochenteri TaxID=2763260 RepID=UPI001CFF97AC|nr:porin [Oceaniglobus trochenteri]
MKKILLASTALIMSAGFAAAEVTVGGDGRMGIIDNFDDDLAFTSRIRISFAASGETDGGLSFGGSIRADNAASGNGNENMTAGTVFISGAFGKLSMGDVDGAAKAAVGHVSGVGLTGLGDLNEMSYAASGGNMDKTGALYEYNTGGLTFYASAAQPDTDQDTAAPGDDTFDAYAVGVKYAWGDYTVALGYEDNEAGVDHIIVGGTASFGDATVKAIYGHADFGATDGDQYSISLDYVFGATTATAFYADDEDLGGVKAYGLGASYDLGGGAALKGGYVKNDTADVDGFDFGISMSF